MFTDIAGKSISRTCGSSVAVKKELTVRQQYKTKHQELLNNLSMEQMLQDAEELRKNQTSQ